MRTPCRSLTRAFVVASAAAITGAALGQCPSPDWLPGDGIAGIQGFTEYFGGVVGEVNSSILWDPDGAGPQGPMVGGVMHSRERTRR